MRGPLPVLALPAPPIQVPAAGGRRGLGLRRLLATLRNPLTLARLVASLGVITVLSAVSPDIRSRTALLTDVMPELFPQAATVAALLAGLLMLVVARSLRRGKFRAWLLAVVLASSSIGFDLVKGLDVEEAFVAVLLLGLLVRARASFIAKPDPASVRPAPLTPDDGAAVRDLIGRWGEQDSLSYFATRTDRSLILSANGAAGVTYRIVGAVSLAGGDPIGNPDCWPGAINAWLTECDAYGWTPAVLGASEAGATAYRRAGLDALELGDEAVVDTVGFTLAGREMRGIRQAVSRCERMGMSASCVRVRDLGRSELEQIAAYADQWRDGAVERGFSMALGRFVDQADADTLLVLAHGHDHQLHGILSLVPWGSDGLSLDLMRRDRESANGVVEFLVAALCQAAPELGVRRISLNFAVFRSAFARGDRIGAGPILRLWCGVLRILSRFWQIESLYRANDKFRPAWIPRFVCFRHPADLPRIGAAALRAEAFLVLPGWARRGGAKAA